MRLVSVLLATLLACAAAVAAQAAPPPKLVVVIVIDQMRYDYVEKFEPWYVDGGFRRFLRGGATFTNARYPYGVMYTAAGHATIGAGRVPAETGIVGNMWLERNGKPFDLAMWDWYYDDSPPYRLPGSAPAPKTVPADAWIRATTTGNPRYAAYDGDVRVTAGRSSGMSPSMILTSDGLGDAAKKANPQSRVIGLALKDRTGILLAGRSADVSYWFDSSVPGFLSSSWYHPDPAAFEFNRAVEGYFPASKAWTISGLIPPADLERVTFDPPEAWPLKLERYNTTFPHKAISYSGLFATPIGNDMLADFAKHVIITSNLGGGSAPDLLFMSFSPSDYVGHYYGPDSREVAENMVRLDRTLASFFDMLDRRLGRDYTVVVSSDHGIQRNPLVAKLVDPQADTGRVELSNAAADAKTVAELPVARLELERRIAKRLGLPFSTNTPIEHSLVFFFEEPGFYLNWKRIAALHIGRERALNTVRDSVLSMKKEYGFDRVWTISQFDRPVSAVASDTERLMRRSIRADRSPDIIIALRPGWMWGFGTNETKHGQPVEADRHVPMMFWGQGIKAGRYDADASPVDIARSLGALLGIEAGGPDSHVLPCIEPAVH
jgi:predicted AlkP superfamily pyrophosphatase or phosphodiesterase